MNKRAQVGMLAHRDESERDVEIKPLQLFSLLARLFKYTKPYAVQRTCFLRPSLYGPSSSRSSANRLRG